MLMGCWKELERFVPGRRQSKYCCAEHSKLAQRYHQNIWLINNPKKVYEANKRYIAKKKLMQQQNENQENQTN